MTVNVTYSCAGVSSQQIIPVSEHVWNYRFHGFSLTLVSNCQRVGELFDNMFGYFRKSERCDNPTFTLHFYTVPQLGMCDAEIAATKRIESSWSRITFRPVPYPVLYLFDDKILFLKDIVQGYGVGYLSLPYTDKDIQYVYSAFLLPAVANMLWTQELFYLHASAVAMGNRGIVICGESGRGKTTLLLHLLKAGCQYLADDTVLLQKKVSGIILLSLPTMIRITPQTVRFFPELSSLISLDHVDERGKYKLTFSSLTPLPPLRSARPVLLLFPKITTDTESTIQPLTAIEAAVQFIPDNLVVSQMAMSHTHLAVLSYFVQHTRCYRIRLGQEMCSIGSDILELLRSHV